MQTVAELDARPVLTLELEGPRPQRRATVAFRLVLAIPHFLYLAVLSFVAFFAVVAAWFATLVTARMPDGLGTFISRVLQYHGRVYAYGWFLLTDRYPSFALDDPDYPVSVRAPYGGRLNRAAVFFRGILLIPVWIAQQILLSGVTACIVFIWLIVLVAGRMPRSLFEAEAATLRYYLRFLAFAAMLTSEYPRGLFGDPGLASDEDPRPWAPPPPAPGDGSGWPSEDADETDWSQFAPPEPQDLEPVPNDPSPLAPPQPSVTSPGAPPAAPRVTKLVLSKAAKRLVVLFIVVGILFSVGLQILAALQEGDAEQARRDLNNAYAELADSAATYGGAVQSCAVRQSGLECVHAAASDFRDAVHEFRLDLRDIDMPQSGLALADEIDDDAARIDDVLSVMSATPDPNTYDAQAFELQRLLQEFDRDVAELDDLLAVEF